MNKAKNRVFALALTFITLLSCTACKSDGNVIGGEEKKDDKYNILEYSDFDKAAAWMKENVEDTDTPPVEFMLDGKSSNTLVWKKSVSEVFDVTDFPDDDPQKRSYRNITYVNEENSLRIELTLTSYPDYPVIEYEAFLYNDAEVESPLVENILSINRKICETSEGLNLRYSEGCDFENMEDEVCTEYSYYVDKFPVGSEKELKTEHGKPTMEFLPEFNVEDTAGNCGVIAVLGWQGDWKAKFTSESDGVHLIGGQKETELNMLPGESMRLPMVVLLFYKGDYANGQNVWRRWFYNCNLLREQGKRMTTNILICYSEDPTHVGMNSAEADLKVISLLKRSGMAQYVDHFNTDAGWYPCGSWDGWGYTGNWTYDRQRYPDGMMVVSDAVREAGMEFALWFEPERFISGTKFFNKVGAQGVLCCDEDENFIEYKDIPGNTNCLINYGDEETFNYTLELMDQMVTDYGVDQIRFDYNIYPAKYWHAYDKKMAKELGIMRTGSTENHYGTAYLKMYEELLKRHPGLIFDSCAGGGTRYDLGTARYAFMHTRSDFGVSAEKSQCDNYTIAMWCQIQGSGGNMADPYSIRSAFVADLGIPGYVSNYTYDAEIKYMREFEKTSPYLFEDYYPLTEFSRSMDDVMSYQYHRPSDNTGLVVIYFRSPGKVTLKLRDLDENATYKLYLVDRPLDTVSVSGAELAAGYEFSADKQSAPIYMYSVESESESN